MEKPQVDFLNHFHPYSSIELSTNGKFVKNILNANFHQKNILWVATQKIHGANFSIIYNFQPDLIKYARRTDFITQKIPVPVQDVTPYFKQNFFDSSSLVNTFHNNLHQIKNKVLKKYENIKGIQIYGEYFGGTWPNHPNYKRRVQPGVYYTPNHEFMAFDIRLFGQTFNTWVEVIEIEEIVKDVLKHVPIHGKGNFEEIQRVNSQFDSKIPQLLGLETLQDNICEGLILRPNQNLFHKNRIILKKKNKQFLEKVGMGKKLPQQKAVNNKQVIQEVEFLKTFINSNRIQSAISKYPDFEDQFHIKGKIIEDVMADAIKQGFKLSDNSKLAKQINKKIDKIVLDEVIDYLKNERKQFIERIKKQNESLIFFSDQSLKINDKMNHQNFYFTHSIFFYVLLCQFVQLF